MAGYIPIGGLPGSGTAEVVPTAYCDYSVAPDQLLSTTPTIVTGWVAQIQPVGASESAGRFTVSESGIMQIHLERIYKNTDNNPAAIIEISISVEQNGTEIFSRTAPIMSATANDEPAIDTFTTPTIRQVSAGDYFEVFVSATEGGSNPEDTRLIRMKITANMIHKSN